MALDFSQHMSNNPLEKTNLQENESNSL